MGSEFLRLDNETHVHPRTPSVKSSVGKARQTRASAASVWSPAEAERTVKSARPAFGGCNVSYAAPVGRRPLRALDCYARDIYTAEMRRAFAFALVMAGCGNDDGEVAQTAEVTCALTVTLTGSG